MAVNYLNLANIDQAVNQNQMAGLQRDNLLQQMMRQKKQQADEDALNSSFNESMGADGIDGDSLVKKLMSKGLGRQAYEMQTSNAANKLTQQKAKQEQQSGALDYAVKAAKYSRDKAAQWTPQTYGQGRAELIANGVIKAEDLPEEYNPEVHKAFVMDADSFIKQQGGGSDQEYVYQNTTNGLLKLGKRGDTKPEILINPETGKPYMASSASPELQGEISYSRANGRNQSDLGYKPQIREAEAGVDLRTKPAIAEAESKAKEIGKTNAENLQLIPNAEDALTSVQAAKDMLNAGIYAGGYSDLKQKTAKYTPLGSDTTLANTEKFISHIGNTVVPRLKEFGGNDSNEEMRYLKSIMGGDVSMQPEALADILDSVEKKIQRGIEYKQQGLDANGKRVAKAATPTKSLSPVNKQGWNLHIDAKGNKAYVSPDGKQFQEVK